jgi:hypothetical protein
VTARADGSCLMEVSGEGRLESRLRVVGEGEETRRGLHLVESIATAWGCGAGGGTARPCGPW